MEKSKTVNFYTDQEKHAIIKDYLTSGKSVKEIHAKELLNIKKYI